MKEPSLPPRKLSNGKVVCAISGKDVPHRAAIPLDIIHPNVAERIRRDYPDLPGDAVISKDVLSRYRILIVEELLEAEIGELSELEHRVARALATSAHLAENVEEQFERKRTLPERLSDDLATFGGSWTFIMSFGLVLVVWIAINIWQGRQTAFDPYPFILLNLVLSCLAAIQAPIIMMSQKRLEAKDRMRSLNDYQVNLKAELEIRQLHEKLDHLLNRQWQRLLEIQKLQMESMEGRRR